MKKEKFRKLLKICIDNKCLITWDKLFRIPESVVDLVIKYNSKNVVDFVILVANNAEELNEAYILKAIEFIVQNKVEDYHGLYATLRKQNIDFDLIELLFKIKTPIKRDAIKVILEYPELVNSFDIKYIINIIMGVSDMCALKIANYITKVYNKDVKQILEGVIILAQAKNEEDLERVYKILTDASGIAFSINISFAREFMENPGISFENIWEQYKKTINKLVALQDAIKNTSLVEVLAKISSYTKSGDLNYEDVILALYHHKLPENVSRLS